MNFGYQLCSAHLVAIFDRRRINHCLEQLRALLPFTTTMKRDMASLLEQAVEYINTMHIVLNEERPACLSKIYTIYQKKLEEHEYCRKPITKSAKRRIASSGSCSSTVETQPTSPLIDHPAGYMPTPQQQCVVDSSKRRCLTVEEGANCNDTYTGLMNDAHYRNMTPHQAILLEPEADVNNNFGHHCPGIAYSSAMSGCRQGQGPCGSNSMLRIGPEFLFNNCNQYALYHGGAEDTPQPALARQYAKSYGTTPKLSQGSSYSNSPTLNKDTSAVATESLIGCNQCTGDTRNEDSSTAIGRDLSVPKFSISSLVYKEDDKVENCRALSYPSGYTGQHFEPKAMEFAFPSDALQRNNPAQNLLAPLDMSSPSGEKLQSPQFVGVNKVLGNGDRSDMLRGLSYGGRDMGLLLRASSVSNMLNDVSTPSDGVPRGSFGSTEKKVTPYLGWLRTPCAPRAHEDTPNTESASTSASNASPKSANDDEVTSMRDLEMIHTPNLRVDESV